MTRKKDLPNDVCLIETRSSNLLQLSKPQEGQKKRTFSMLAYTGNVIQSPWGPIVLDVQGMQIANQNTPILFQHNPESIAGYSTRIDKPEDKSLVIEGVLCSTPEGRKIADLSDEGFPWQASVGLQVLSWKFVDVGVTVNVNGRDIPGPVDVAVKSVLRESSFTPMGVDSGTRSVVLSSRIGDAPREVHVDEKELEVERKKTAESAVKTERERISAIKSAFPNDQKFALEQIEAGSDLLTAKAACADKLSLDLENQKAATRAAEEKLQKAAQKTTPKPDSGPAPVGFAGSASGSAEGKDFMALADEYRQNNKCSHAAAMSAVARKHPDVHAAFVDASRSRCVRSERSGQ